MSLTLRKLLQNPALRLRIVSDGNLDAGEDPLEREFEWLHATDMLDPTPFLGPAEVILTLGWQFPITASAEASIPETHVPPARLAKIYDDYAALISAHGVIGVGFGSDVVHRGVPQALAQACERHGLILFDVPYEISFMDLLQEAARVMQRDQAERYGRSLRVQKAIASAATRRDGLSATLRETARQLGCGVILYDSLARPITVVPMPGGSTPLELITPAVQSTLNSGARFRSVQLSPRVEAVIQLLGEPGDPSGVLVLALSQSFDDVSRNVLSSVLALVSVSLEQNQHLERLHRTLRQALLELLLSGSVQVTKHIVDSVLNELPSPPLAAMVGIPQKADVARLSAALESLAGDNDAPFFFAPSGSRVVFLTRLDSAERLAPKLEELGLALGTSRCDTWDGLARSLEEAGKAAEFGLRRGAGRMVSFPEIWREGIADLIDASDAQHVARRMLQPLSEHEQRHGGELLQTLETWLVEHGRPQPTARALGIHRHTLAARLELISDLCGLDLSDHQQRAEASLALRYHRP